MLFQRSFCPARAEAAVRHFSVRQRLSHSLSHFSGSPWSSAARRVIFHNLALQENLRALPRFRSLLVEAIVISGLRLDPI